MSTDNTVKPIDRFNVHIKSLTFNDGTTVQLEPGCTLILTGPNNCGKSLTLSNIFAGAQNPSGSSGGFSVVRSVVMGCEGTKASFTDWVRQSYPAPSQMTNDVMTVRNYSFNKQQWPDQLNLTLFAGGLMNVMVRNLDAQSRFGMVGPSASIPYDGAPSADIHFLQRDPALLEEVSALVRSAFGRDLIINWGGGNTVWYHIGFDPPKEPGQDRVSPEYLDKLRLQPLLANEGDGVKCFVAVVLAAHVGFHPILIIDEPEAFLHPPQARRIGAILARTAATRRRQVILATHSTDIIRGATDVSSNVIVCRMQRHEYTNHVSELGTVELRDLWSKPLLRSSVAINGLFHSGVVVCEGDADCRVYEALDQQQEKDDNQPLDLYFVHGGGKGALAPLAKSYRSLSIPTAVIADLDLLRNNDEFRILYQVLGGDPVLINPVYTRVSAALNDRKPLVPISEFTNAIEEWLRSVRAAKKFESAHRRQLSIMLDSAAEWSEVKRYGINRLTGEELTAGKELLSRCAEVGLFLVPEGELERWWREGPSDKNMWIAQAIPKLNEDPLTFKAAADFVEGIRRSFKKLIR